MHIVTSTDILLPRAEDMGAWSVIACDQFTSEPEYWAAAEARAAEKPSTLSLMLPEAWLHTARADGADGRIADTMRRYLAEGVFQTVPDSFIYVERTLSDGRVRRGLVAALDLEQCDFTGTQRASVRSTEGTVEERLPPRVNIRRGAPLEMPHTLLLMDDRTDSVLSLAEKAKDTLEKVYDFDLMLGGGHIAGWRVSGETKAAVQSALDALDNAALQREKYGDAAENGKLTFAANGAVPGALNNQFSLDERDGYLRMATTEQTYSYSVYRDEKHDFENTKADEDGMQTRNDVYVLDASLKTVGSVTGLAEGEQVFSARFDGDYGYLCTYRQTDPVFAVDLTEPTNPKVVGELKLSGYSDYLHIWSDGLLFGLGMEMQLVGANTTVDGMKLVMIDTSDPAKLHDLHTQAIDADYSEALNNHKAILVDSGKDIIAFPAENSYLVYGYSADDGFTLRKEISVSQWDGNNRGLYIGDYFYVVGSDQINVLDLNTLENAAQAIIPRG
mgnify:CR=1 FL=1